jgi:hypothetical protein
MREPEFEYFTYESADDGLSVNIYGWDRWPAGIWVGQPRKTFLATYDDVDSASLMYPGVYNEHPAME